MVHQAGQLTGGDVETEKRYYECLIFKIIYINTLLKYY